MKKRTRVVVDTNVIVSGLISKRGFPYKIIDMWLDGKIFQPIICKRLQEEVNEVLRRLKIKNRANYDDRDIKTLLGILFNRAENIKPKSLDKELFSDTQDHFLLELAISAKAKFIVSGDAGILKHTSYKDIEFLSPEAFCSRF